jgi:UDP-N-acetylmuramoylalanine--D-glutamate ligase
MDSADHFIYYKEDPIVNNEVNNRAIFPQVIQVSLKDENERVNAINASMSFNLHGQLEVIDQKDTSLKGSHNLINTMMAVSAAMYVGISIEIIKSALKTFVNAPHRLESVATINGVEYVNDSKATNVDSVVYGLGSYTQSLVWIAGGIDKGNDYNLIMDQVKEKVRVLICLGRDNEKLKKAFNTVVPNIVETQSVRELIKIASELAKTGEVVLLSPACASFDLFKNYEDRGDQFRQAVLELKSKTEMAKV